jgi:hypothetical protein
MHYDFGVINVGAKGNRKFVVRNEGAGDLTLSVGGTSCKCTIAELGSARVPPGGSTEIELSWEGEEETKKFRQGARITTNDPLLREFDLVVEGRVLVEMAVHPTSVIFQGIPRRTDRTNHLLIYSQQTADVRIRRVETTGKTLDVALDEVDAKTREQMNARWIRDVAVTIHSGDRLGFIAENVRVYYTLGESAEERMFEFGVAGEVIGDFQLGGRDVAGNTLLLGTVRQSDGGSKSAHLLVRGEHRADLQLRVETCKPAGLEVGVGPAQSLSATMTRYPLTVRAPGGLTPGNFSSETGLGEVVLKTTHPDHPTVRFFVSLVVTPD